MFDYAAFKAYIEENGFKQKFIAQKADITEATLSAILTGRVKCSLEAYVNLCKAVAVPFGKFLNDGNGPAAA